jgi:hypothetical protein
LAPKKSPAGDKESELIFDTDAQLTQEVVERVHAASFVQETMAQEGARYCSKHCRHHKSSLLVLGSQ